MDLLNPKTEKPKYSVIQNTVWMIQTALKSCPMLLLTAALIDLADIAFSLSGMYMTPAVISIIENQQPVSSLLVTIGLFTAALLLTKWLSAYFEGYFLCCRIETRCAVIEKIAWKCNTTSYPNTFKEEFIGLRDKAHHSISGNNGAAESIWLVLGRLVKNVFGLICCLFILSSLNPFLLLLCVLTCLLSFLASQNASRWVYENRDTEMKYLAEIRYIRSKAESSRIAKEIRTFKMQNWMEDIMNRIHHAYLAYRLKVARRYFFSDLADALLTMIRSGLICTVLIWLVLAQKITIADFVLFFAALTSFTNWVSQVFLDFSELYKDSLEIGIIRAFLEYPEPFDFEQKASIPKADQYEICLKDVSYRYPGSQKDIVCHMNLTIRPGENLAIVGTNGAGKTTLVKLVCGLLDPDEGQVLLNGRDIRSFNRKEYYRLFSAVFQEFSLLDVTFQECITQSVEPADEQKLKQALQQAGLEEMAADLPNGPATHVGREVFEDGVQFSGGEMQRLILARALYKNGSVLLLDEPTAALDPIAENEMYLKYHEMTAGRTSLFISHRLASTRFCDRIIYLENGRIAEEGTHDSLLEQKGSYAHLFDVQSRYYQEGGDF